MKINTYKSALWSVLTVGISLTSCNKQLDELGPHNVTNESILFSTPNGYQRAIEGVYSLSISAWTDRLIMTGEAGGDNLRKLEVSRTQESDIYDYAHSYVMNIWSPNYKLIQHANLILDNVSAGETDATKLEAKAEALFARAFSYFNIVKCYGRPYYQNPETNLGAIVVTTGADDGKRGRNTVKQTYDQIIADLQASLPVYTSNRGSSYANVYASKALLSRVYLYMTGPYASANKPFADSVIKYANQVIAGPYKLATGASYTSYYNLQNTAVAATEDIFDTNTQSTTASLLHGIFTPIVSTYAGIYSPSPDLISLLNQEKGDLRRKLLKKVTFTRSTFADDTLSTIKYNVSGTNATTRYSFSPIRHIRLIEMYLNRAEAYAKLGQDANALSDLNVVRVRAGLPALTSGSLTGQALFNAIFTQRRIELAFEGHNAFDYYRNGLTMTRNFSYLPTPGFPLVTSVSAMDPIVVLRIPYAELILNTQLQQNVQ